jgi:hypothetical protein
MNPEGIAPVLGEVGCPKRRPIAGFSMGRKLSPEGKKNKRKKRKL